MSEAINMVMQWLVPFACGITSGFALAILLQRPAAIVMVKHPLWDRLEAIAADLHRTAKFVGTSHEHGAFVIERSGTVETDSGSLTVIFQRHTGKVDHDC